MRFNLSSLPPSLVLLVANALLGFALPQHHWEVDDAQVVLESATSQQRGAVACESKVCSQIGIDLLTLGGNAVDAWVGTQLCVGVIGMYHSGLGGGGFALIRDGDGGYFTIDYRETAPEAAFEDMYNDNVNGSVFGGLAAGVPGELRGLEYAHKKFGVLPWHDVVQPAILVARDGFAVTEDTIRYMTEGTRAAGWNFLVEDPSWAQDFAPNGSLVKLGDTMYRSRYSETLQKVAENGADVFYTGDIAEATISTIQDQNGTMTLEDLAGYEIVIRPAINITYHGYRLYSTGSPTGGAVGLSILKTIEGYENPTADINLMLHRFDEAMRFAYGARQELGDPAYVEGVDEFEARMLNPSQAAAIRAHIMDNTTQPVKNYYYDSDDGTGGDKKEMHYATPGHGTSHIVTADGTGMAVSSTTTINLLFGNLQMVESTGVILNNEMNDFSIPGVRNEFGFEPSEANFIRPGKRPLSSITPIMIAYDDGDSDNSGSRERLYAIVGAAGGSRIISASTQVALHMLEHHGHTMADAIWAPRIHDQLMPNIAVFEAGFDKSMVSSMADRGHNVTWVDMAASSVQGISVDRDGQFEAASENRQVASGGLTL